MMRRRNALRAVVSGLIGSIWAFIACAPLRRENSHSTVADSEQALLAKQLERDLSLLARRNYAEEGIPMFLVGENLASKDRASTRQTSSLEGVALAQELRRDAAAFDLHQPNATEADVAKLLEVLAERNFGMALIREGR
jgi:hypothetical protein